MTPHGPDSHEVKYAQNPSDFLGRPLAVGDYVFYARNLGRVASLALGEIKEFRFMRRKPPPASIAPFRSNSYYAGEMEKCEQHQAETYKVSIWMQDAGMGYSKNNKPSLISNVQNITLVTERKQVEDFLEAQEADRHQRQKQLDRHNADQARLRVEQRIAFSVGRF